MREVLIALACFAAFFGASLAGLLFHRHLPAHHRHERSHDVLRNAANMIALIASVLLAFLVTSMQDEFNKVDAAVRTYGADLTLLDTMLRTYGPDTADVRVMLRDYAGEAMSDLWPGHDRLPQLEDARADGLMNRIATAVLQLEPRTHLQRVLLPELATEVRAIEGRRLQIVEQGDGGIPTPFLVLTSLWLVFCFGSFGFNAPRNLFVVSVLLLATLSMAGALYLIIDLGTPFGGFVQVSSAPLHRALAAMAAP